jgi:signal transduction histidine kinase
MRIPPLPTLLVGAAYICGHLLLDWLSFVHPFGSFGITPWNASTGLSLAFVLLAGSRMLPVILAAQLLADVLARGMPVPLWLLLAEAVFRTSLYGLACLALSRSSARFDPKLSSVRDLFLLLSAAALISIAIAVFYVTLLVASGLLPLPEAQWAVLRSWVGDMIGIAVVTPFGLLAYAGKLSFKLGWETALQMASSLLLTLWVAVVYAEHDQLQLFYLLFLPLTWIAVRSGIEGVSAALVLIQAGLVVAILVFARHEVDVLDFQARMLVLAGTGLFAGILVSVHRLSELQLRMNQDALAHLSRLGSMGELAAAIAHEINQPLSAARTYTELVAESLQNEKLKDAATVEIASKAASEISRAAEVVRRLRALVRTGRIHATPTSLARIVDEAADLARPDLERQGILLKTEIAPGLPCVVADRLQVEQVLLNLIRNSAEAIVAASSTPRHITVRARAQGTSCVEISVRDTGPGFPASFPDGVPPPLSTTKVDGLGIGLSLCRSIAEAHGGTLTIQTSRSGATVRITLPTIVEGCHE